MLTCLIGDMGRPNAQQKCRGRPAVNAQRRRPTWTEPAAQAELRPTKRGGKARRTKAQQHGHLSHGAIAKAKRLGDLTQRLQTLIADQFPPSWAAPPSVAQLMQAYNAAYGTLQPQHFGFKSAHHLLFKVLPEALAPAAPVPVAKRRPPPPRPPAGPAPPLLRAQEALLWRAPTVASRLAPPGPRYHGDRPQSTPSSQLHEEMLRFAELMLPDVPTLRLRREALLRVSELAEATFPGCQVEAASSNRLAAAHAPTRRCRGPPLAQGLELSLLGLTLWPWEERPRDERPREERP